MNDLNNKIPPLPPKIVTQNPVVRWLLILLGWLLVVIGVIGIFVPGLPTTVFIIGAVWAFSRSSRRFQKWLWYHPVFGAPVRDWYVYRVIPMKAKVMAVAMMMLSVLIMAYLYRDNLIIPLYMAGGFVPIAFYICLKASKRPEL